MDSAGPSDSSPVDRAGPVVAEPLILPLQPRRGWAVADAPRRACAVAWVVAVVAVGVSALTDRPVRDVGGWQAVLSVVWAFVVLLAGPPLSYSAARVLRPHARRSPERVARHWAAAVATPYGVAVLGTLGAWGRDSSRLWLFAGVPDLVLVLEIVAASLLGSATLAWGLLALLWRAADRWPTRLGWVRAFAVRTDDAAEDGGVPVRAAGARR